MLIENIEPALYADDSSLVISLRLGPSENFWAFIFVSLLVEYAAHHQSSFSVDRLLA